MVRAAASGAAKVRNDFKNTLWPSLALFSLLFMSLVLRLVQQVSVLGHVLTLTHAQLGVRSAVRGSVRCLAVSPLADAAAAPSSTSSSLPLKKPEDLDAESQALLTESM